jgi:phosphohistidine phosphatase
METRGGAFSIFPQSTMKTLLLLRHAKSSWDDAALSDHQRPLNRRGEKAAPRIGQLLAEEGLLPDRILCSTAVRARQTAEHVVRHSGYVGEVDYRANLYLAPPEAYLEVLSQLPDDVNTVLAVGHNPGMEDLLYQLTGKHEHFPTAGLARIDFSVAAWSKLDAGARGKLIHLWRPKELDD